VNNVFELINRLNHVNLGRRTLEVSLEAVFGETGAKIMILGVTVNSVLKLAELESVHKFLE
jgi:hypothetical protein